MSPTDNFPMFTWASVLWGFGIEPCKYGHTCQACILTILFVSHAQDHLWSSVVSSHHIRGHHEAGARSPRQTKVQDFQGAIWLDDYIAWFEVLEMGGGK